ncbi:MAG: DHH family phosphoesterase, partial [Bacillota bacterium]|nr:DHH family phosphoesterase [Bacillota bacterium]
MLRQTSANTEALAHQTGFDPVLVRLLAVRGYKEPEDIQNFLCPENCELADPLLFADMDKAILRIQKALAEGEAFVVFGDYDADGIMSTVILLRCFSALGANPAYYIPKRDGEGYGLNNAAIFHLAEQGIRLIVACDNGISAFEQIEYAQSLGIDVVVFDHHDITLNERGEQILPAACAVVDAKRQDCAYPFKYYCAAALCYRFSQLLFSSLGRDWQALQQDLLPLAALASVCDIVELQGENRCLVKQGLPAILKSRNCGLRALLQVTELENTEEISTYHVGFVLGPCINAAGRMGQVDIAIRLFLSESPAEAEQLAAMLLELNQQRRKMTESGTAAVFEQIEEKGLEKDKVIVVHSAQITESIAGIIAGRVKERYYHPTIVIGGDGELLRGSGRSIHGYNIFDALSEVRDLFPS